MHGGYTVVRPARSLTCGQSVTCIYVCVWDKVQIGESVPIQCQGYHGGYSSYTIQCMTNKKFDPQSLMVGL